MMCIMKVDRLLVVFFNAIFLACYKVKIAMRTRIVTIYDINEFQICNARSIKDIDIDNALSSNNQ